MTQPYERLAIVHRPAARVIAFRPRKTARGHYVWSPDHEVTEWLGDEAMAQTEHAGLRHGSLYNLRLKPDEVLKFIAGGSAAQQHQPADAIAAILEMLCKTSVHLARGDGVILRSTARNDEIEVDLHGEKFLIKASRITR